MKALTFLRLLLYLVFVLGAHLASAQLADREPAAPRVALDSTAAAETLSAGQRRDQVLRTLANALQLQPHQTLVLRRALAADPTPTDQLAPTSGSQEVAVAPAEELRLLLTDAQLARLRQWEARQTAGRQSRFIALGQ